MHEGVFLRDQTTVIVHFLVPHRNIVAPPIIMTRTTAGFEQTPGWVSEIYRLVTTEIVNHNLIAF